VKITKVGTKPSDNLWVGSCGNCGSEAEATQAELKKIETCQREGRWAWEVCPVCSAGEGRDGHGGMIFYPK
jgi:hypothetical protein